MSVVQKEITLQPKKKGFHLITDELLPQLNELKSIKAGIVVLNLRHTSASICLNECADPEVRTDMEKFFNRLIPEDLNYIDHTYEGLDDMPAHLKSAIIGSSITIPVTDGRLNLGTWQGIYLGEHRNHGGSRRILVTIMG